MHSRLQRVLLSMTVLLGAQAWAFMPSQVGLAPEIEDAISAAEQSAVQELDTAAADAQQSAQNAVSSGEALPVVDVSSAGRCREMVGMASWYGPGFQGHKTANGERFNTGELTAAHRTLPFGAHIRVTNLHNGRHVMVRINDRGPYVGGRVIDLSRAAAQMIGMDGTTKVSLETCL